MPTYGQYAADRERTAKRAAQDAALAVRHRQFDLSAQDQHVKSERFRFSVVTSSAAFREGWGRIFSAERKGA